MRRLNKIGCHISTSEWPLEETIRQARLLDAVGFDHVQIGDHTTTQNRRAQYPNAQAMLATIGALTKKARIMNAVTDSYRRHPIEIAQWIATEDHLTGGRAALGIGAGEMMNLAPFGIEYHKPLTRLKEAVEVIKLLWRGTLDEPVDYGGKIYRLKRAYLQILPVQKPRPPIFVGAQGKFSRELVGEVADGWTTVFLESPTMLREHIPQIERGANKAGKKISDMEIMVSLYSGVSDDRQKLIASMAPRVRTGLVMEREQLKRYTKVEVPDELSIHGAVLTNETSDKIGEAAGSIPEELVEKITDETAAVGTAEDCIKKIEQFLDAGATSIVICDVSRDWERLYNTYAKDVIPYLKREYGP